MSGVNYSLPPSLVRSEIRELPFAFHISGSSGLVCRIIDGQ